MKGRIVGGVLLASLEAFGCDGAEQTPEEFAADVQEIQRKALQGLRPIYRGSDRSPP